MQFDSATANIRQEIHDPVHYVFGYDPLKKYTCIVGLHINIIWVKHVKQFMKYPGRVLSNTLPGYYNHTCQLDRFTQKSTAF